MYTELKDVRYEGKTKFNDNMIYFSFFPENFDVKKCMIVKESISIFRNAFDSTSKYYSTFAKENENFNTVLFYEDVEYKTLMIPIISSNGSEFCKFIVNQIKNKSKMWGFDKTTTLVIPKYIDVKEIFSIENYERLNKYIRKYYKLIIL